MEIVHLKTYLPTTKPETVVFLNDELAITAPPGPSVCVQVPVPTVGLFPFRLMLAKPHCVMAVPPLAVVAAEERVIKTVSRVEAHPPLFKLHSNLYVPFAAPLTVVL